MPLLFIVRHEMGQSGNGTPERNFPSLNFSPSLNSNDVRATPTGNIVAVRAIWGTRMKRMIIIIWQGKSKNETERKSFPQMELNCVCFIVSFSPRYLLLLRHMFFLLEIFSSAAFRSNFISCEENYFRQQNKFSIYGENDKEKVHEQS